MTLALNKTSLGYYTSTHGDMTITVSNTAAVIGGKNQWQILIVKGDEIVLSEFANTKTKCYEMGTRYLIDQSNKN